MPPGKFGPKVAAPCLTAEELKLAAEAAVTQAAAEGLELMASENNASGFMNVNFQPGNAAKPWKGMARIAGRAAQIRLGNFATKEEAALAVARHLGKDEQERLRQARGGDDGA